MKTPEEMAQQYVSTIADTHSVKAACEKAFIVGYQAAQEHAHAALEEAEARIQELRDQLMEESGGRLKLFKDDADAKAAYQEALEEVDLDKAWQQGYKTAEAEYQEKLNQMRLERPAFKKHEIENLLSQANADGYKRGFEQGLIAQKCWISVDERLPEIEEVRDDYKRSKCALWIDYDKDIVVGYHLTIGDRTRVMTGFSEPPISNFTHWQELPEPPKEEE